MTVTEGGKHKLAPINIGDDPDYKAILIHVRLNSEGDGDGFILLTFAENAEQGLGDTLDKHKIMIDPKVAMEIIDRLHEAIIMIREDENGS